ncbi:MAG: hypothetical protein ACK42Y_05725, partial [Candidatus Thermochlorobacter sp.]
AGFFGIAFQTLPRTRITGAFVAALNGSNPRNVVGIDAATTTTFGDTAGRIVLRFNQPLRGQYKVRGSDKVFLFDLIDTTTNRNGDPIIIGTALTTFNNLKPSTAGAGVIITTPPADLEKSAFIDSIATKAGNELFVRYYVSKYLLNKRGYTTGSDNKFIVRFCPSNLSASDALEPRRVLDDSTRASTLIGEPRPSTLRGRSGDFGVAGLDTTTTIANKLSAIRTSTQDAFDLKIAIRAGGTSSSAFPDFMVNAVRNATEMVTNVTQRAVSTVRSWWNRFRGE